MVGLRVGALVDVDVEMLQVQGADLNPTCLDTSRVISERQLRYCRHGGAGERYFTEDDKLGDCTQKLLL